MLCPLVRVRLGLGLALEIPNIGGSPKVNEGLTMSLSLLTGVILRKAARFHLVPSKILKLCS
jgi:hypothetical protein